VIHAREAARRSGSASVLLVLTLSVLLIALWPARLTYAEEENWFGVNKVLHFIVGFGAGAGSSLVLGVAFPNLSQGTRFWLASAMGSVPGVLKELDDQLHPPNYFSVADLTYNVLGSLIGAGFVFLISG
jgi:cytochrome bd-type quinol oxidase subunit 2